MTNHSMRIELILLPITNIDAAIAFYANRLGFHIDYDITRDDAPRVVQLTPPGSSCSIMLDVGAANGGFTAMPPWATVYQQTQRWVKAGVFEAIVHDLRALLRLANERDPEPTAVIFDRRTLQSSPESGHDAGYDGAKRRKGRKTHMAVDTLGQLLAMLVTPASEQDRAQVGQLAEAVQETTGETVVLAFVDQVTLAMRPPRQPKNTAFAWRWSSCPTPRKGSCCCLAAGSSSVVLAGWPVFDAWLATMNACRLR